jgi:xylulokinase
MATGYLLGIDVGTTNTKAVVFDPAGGSVVAVASRQTRTHHSRPDWSEFDAEEIWQGVAECVREVSAGRARDIGAVAVACMAEAGVPLDEHGRPVYPVIAWHDPRSQPQANRWHDLVGAERVFAITGQAIGAKFSLNKLLWLRDNEPEVFGSVRKWLCVEEYVNWRLSGEFATDYSIASRTLAFDQTRLDWSPTMLDAAGIPASLFSTPHPAGTAVGRVTGEAATATGLRTGTLVVTGGHDHLCGSLAAGVVGPGAFLESIGTAEACLMVSDHFSPSPALLKGGFCTYAHVIAGQYVTMFGLNSSGGLVEWLVTKLWPPIDSSREARDRSFEAGRVAAALVSAGSDGVFWLPYLAGASAPWDDERARACVVGLTGAHTSGHLYRALLEGFGYWLRESVDILGGIVNQRLGERIMVIGGGSRSTLWMQVKADVTGRAVSVVDVPEATALGAALLAGIGAGEFATAAEAATAVRRPATVYEPDPARHAKYTRLYEDVFESVYPALREVNHRIAAAFQP